MNKNILIIGGMSPVSSIYAHNLLIKKAIKHGAKNNDEFPLIVHFSINIKDSISSNGNILDKDKIKNTLLNLNMKSVSIGFIACNTVHKIFNEINEICENKLISLIDVVKINLKNNQKVGILCTPCSTNNHIYGSNVHYLDTEKSLELEGVIRNIINDKINQKDLIIINKSINNLLNRGCDKIILGCTELSVISSKIKSEYKEYLIDPIELITERMLNE